MSLATLDHPQTASLGELVDGLALRSGAWVVVERLGTVVCHGAGHAACPAPLAEALLSKSTRPLRDAVTWHGGGRTMRGTVAGIRLTAVDLGAGATGWFIGGDADATLLPLLAAAAGTDGGPVTDTVVEELLHPRGPSRAGKAPRAVLVVLRSVSPLTVLSRRALAAVAGTEARVHTQSYAVLVALPEDEDPAQLVAAVRASCPDVVAGTAGVRAGASDWTAALRIASAAGRAAAALDLVVGDPSDPAVVAELVVDEARQAATSLLAEVDATPLSRLREYDERTSGDLVPTLSAWCAAGGDVAAAAAALHVHVNTLRYRLRRAGLVSGLDLSRPRQVLALQLLLAV
jgi:hypothetical protein